MSVVKLHRYGVRTYPVDGRRLTLEAPGKPRLHVATAPDFKNGIPGVWSPEELLIGSLASCFELTVLAIAERREVPIHTIQTDATGHVQHKDGLYRFVVLELDVMIETQPGQEAAAESVVQLAKERCIVSGALDVPVRLTVAVHAPAGELTTV